ncbi:hypothetical protein BAY59_26480 [Prauserella coralliicola]|nr:hypothetical protein BAY59_26480 [Prauserella coralliicola]
MTDRYEHFDAVAHYASRTPEKVAIVEVATGRRFTYAELDRRARRLAGVLADAGVERGDRVALLAHNGVHNFDLQFAAGKTGVVTLPMNVRLAEHELETIARDGRPKALLYEQEFTQAAERLRDQAGVDTLIEIGPVDSTDGYEAALRSQPEDFAPAEVIHLDDLAALLYTSGTTGRPKAALLTYGMLQYNNLNCGLYGAVSSFSTHLVSVPLFHIGGLSVYSNPVLNAGGTVVIQRTFDAAQTLALISDPAIGVTHFLAVPAIYQALIDSPGFENADFSRLVMASVGGAPCPLPVLEVLAQRGIPVGQGFGMTETGGPVLTLDPGDAVRKIGSVGKPVLYARARVVGADGFDVAAGKAGELWLRGPGLTRGYWNDVESTTAAFADGWLRTGDVVRTDEDGYFYVVDRLKDMYISGGENVYPAEVERVIALLDGVVDSAVVGTPHEQWGEAGCAFVVVRDGHGLTADDVRAHCRAQLAPYKCPSRVELVDELPRNAQGKVQKARLRAASNAD